MAENRIITSQYVQIDQTPASVGTRVFARVIDYILMFCYLYGLFNLISHFFRYRSYDYEVVLVIFILPVVFYSFIFETFNRGRTPGKMLFGTRVVMRDGSTPTIGAYFMRWMLYLIDSQMGIGIIVMLVNQSNRRIGDIAAGTIVIKERDYHRIHVSLDEFEHLSRKYNPVFPQAENLSLEQINTINEALSRSDENRESRIAALSSKVYGLLKIPPQRDDEAFLRTLTRDFQYYALEEV
ncbi:MAG: RDD family protein [Dysgonamonadaceae bacterium]|jgi:uncharacterized RDD family membrane protein YckC|nr:RDD family protein [Dysgonamonadaceae bacterium]